MVAGMAIQELSTPVIEVWDSVLSQLPSDPPPPDPIQQPEVKP